MLLISVVISFTWLEMWFCWAASPIASEMIKICNSKQEACESYGKHMVRLNYILPFRSFSRFRWRPQPRNNHRRCQSCLWSVWQDIVSIHIDPQRLEFFEKLIIFLFLVPSSLKLCQLFFMRSLVCLSTEMLVLSKIWLQGNLKAMALCPSSTNGFVQRLKLEILMWFHLNYV